MIGMTGTRDQHNLTPITNPVNTSISDHLCEILTYEDTPCHDSLRMYLAEVSQVPLLTPSEEVRLSQQIELARNLKNVESLFSGKTEHLQHINDLTIHILKRLQESGFLVSILRDELMIPLDASFTTILFHPLTRKVIDGEILPEFVNRIAIRSDLHPDEVKKGLLDISLNSRLLPLFFIVEMDSKGLVFTHPDTGVCRVLSSEIQRNEEELAKHFDRVRSEGVQARAHFIEANLRLVVSIARTYPRKVLPLLDMIQEGNIGLIQAVNKYDYRKGNRFSTYATLWIKQAIHRGVADQSRTIRLPVRVVDSIQKYLHIKQGLSLGRDIEPSEEQIAATMSISPQKLEVIMESMKDPVSLESPIGDDIDRCLGDVIIDHRFSLEENVSQLILKDQVGKVLLTLPERESKVLSLRYGLESGYSYTLEEIGHRLRLTRERIRQIEKEALSMVRNCPLTPELRYYTED